MAIVNEFSTQLALVQATPKEFIDTSEWGVTTKRHFDHTRAVEGDDTSYVAFIDIPSGRVRLVMPSSEVSSSAFGAARTLDVGHGGYTNKDGTIVPASDDFFGSAIDISAASRNVLLNTDGEDQTFFFNTRSGFIIRGRVNGGTSIEAATLSGFFEMIHL